MPFFRPHSWRQSFCSEGGTRSLLPSVFLMHEVTLIQEVVQVHWSPPTSSCFCCCSDAKDPSSPPLTTVSKLAFRDRSYPLAQKAAYAFPPCWVAKGWDEGERQRSSKIDKGNSSGEGRMLEHPEWRKRQPQITQKSKTGRDWRNGSSSSG